MSSMRLLVGFISLAVLGSTTAADHSPHSRTATPLADDAPGGANPIQPGQPLPRIMLPKIDGSGWIDLAALRGQKVLLIQFASW